MKLVAYLRVSTEAQVDDGLGLPVQREQITRWSKANSHRVMTWHADEGVSGSNGVDQRHGLLDALNDLEDGKAQGLVVAKLDRLARSLTVQEGTLARVWSLGCSCYAVDRGEIPQDDPEDPMATALRQIIGIFAQLERGMIAARLRAGRRLKAEQGGYAYGSPPFGWLAQDGELVPDEAEQATIARITELHSCSYSTRRIADHLNAEGLPSKRGGSWSSATVARIIRSTIPGA